MDVPNLKPRDPDSHKGTHGRALVIGGSRGMTGAVCLTGLSTLRSGAGLVTLAVPDRCLETVAAFNPCYMTVPIEQTARLEELTQAATSIGIGPAWVRANMCNHWSRSFMVPSAVQWSSTPTL